MAYVAYAIMVFLPRDEQHKAVMIWVMAFVSVEMIHAMMRDYGAFVMDITTYTMMLCTKLWGLAWCIRDGFDHKQNLSED
jgi:hypothetical protein